MGMEGVCHEYGRVGNEYRRVRNGYGRVNFWALVIFICFFSSQMVHFARFVTPLSCSPLRLQTRACDQQVRGNRDNILTPDRAAWLRRAKRVEELLRGLRFSVAGDPGSLDATMQTDILTTTPCGRA
jgi:hypothetical protein